MGKILVDTQAVVKTADDIARYNQKIQSEFDSIVHAMNTLQRNWNSPAKEKAINSFNKIKKNYQDSAKNSRYQIINNYVNSLKDVVKDDYVAVEEANIKIAEGYK